MIIIYIISPSVKTCYPSKCYLITPLFTLQQWKDWKIPRTLLLPSRQSDQQVAEYQIKCFPKPFDFSRLLSCFEFWLPPVWIAHQVLEAVPTSPPKWRRNDLSILPSCFLPPNDRPLIGSSLLNVDPIILNCPMQLCFSTAQLWRGSGVRSPKRLTLPNPSDY